MLGLETVQKCIGKEILSPARGREKEICEIRLRINRPARLKMLNGDTLEGASVSKESILKIVSALQMGSFYAVEDQLSQGYFSAAGGIRIGVCGKLSQNARGSYALSSVGSVCIRIPREIKGCAEELWKTVGFSNLLILSRPGMGKTTLLRDYARIASNDGHEIAIADERREIAACVEGVPQLDVGKCSDVIDDCPKARAIMLLLRACAPEMIVVDEIALETEAAALREARKCGVKIAATAHAASLEDAKARSGVGEMIDEGAFSRICILDGGIGKIAHIY